MAKNRWPLIVPCHRVVAASGAPGGFTAPFGLFTKAELLLDEGVSLPGHEDRSRILAATAALAAADPVLGRHIARTGPCRLDTLSASSPFGSLLRAIAHQQLNGRAAETILGRLMAHSGGKLPTPAQLLALSAAQIRAAGFSGAKVLALQDLAAKTVDGTVPSSRLLARLSDEEIIERLAAVRGVGRWTVEMMLIFRLGRLDVLAVDDFGLRKGFGRLFGKGGELGTRAELLARGQRWRPYRSVASWYLWRAAELAAR